MTIKPKSTSARIDGRATATITVHVGMPASEATSSDVYGAKYTPEDKRQDCEIDINIRLDYSQLDVALETIRNCLGNLGAREAG